jgi:hypothetical protein
MQRVVSDSSGGSFVPIRGMWLKVWFNLHVAVRDPSMRENVEEKHGLNERREYFRVNDVLPILVKKVESMMGKKSRILSGHFTALGTSNQAEDLNDGTTNPKLVKMLCEINSKLDLIIEKLFCSEEMMGCPEAKEVCLSASGVSFGYPNELSLGDLIEVKMLLPMHPPVWIVLYGNVTRVTTEGMGEYNIAVKFNEMEDEVRDLLSYYTIKRQREIIVKQRAFDM